MWDGVFAPLAKHRDYQHNTWLEHELDNGATLKIIPARIKVDIDPIEEGQFEPSRDYYAVDLTLTHGGGTWYRFLVPAMSDKSEPTYNRTRQTIELYVKNPVEGGRNYWDYIDRDETDDEAIAMLIQTDQNQPEYRDRGIS